MNHFALIIEGLDTLFLSTNKSEELLTKEIAQKIKLLWDDRQKRILNNYYLENPDKYAGEEKNRPTKKLSLFNEFFKEGKEELCLSMFYNFETNKSTNWVIKKIQYEE